MAKGKMMPHAGIDKKPNTYSKGGKKIAPKRKYACGGKLKK